MKLLTAAQFAQLVQNGRRQAAVKGTPDEIDFKPVVKLFYPCGAATWLLTEIAPDDHSVAWGLCDLGMGFPEFGTVSLTELQTFRGRLGLGIERERHFAADTPISAYCGVANRAGRIFVYGGAGGWPWASGGCCRFSEGVRLRLDRQAGADDALCIRLKLRDGAGQALRLEPEPKLLEGLGL